MDSKAAGMVEVINGGTTSVGAQLRRLLTGTRIKLRKQQGGSVMPSATYSSTMYLQLPTIQPWLL
eukprot:1321897-Pleurochrysis_carterae.AAC.1